MQSKFEQGKQKSWNGRIAIVNLDNKSITYDEHDEGFYRKYMGGSALALYYILKKGNKMGPFNLDDILVFAAGIVTGVPVSGTSRFSITAHSPQTNAIGDSQCGGSFGVGLKKAGLDAIVVMGKAKEPIYFLVKNGRIVIKSAKHIWGYDVGKSTELLKSETCEKCNVAVIGQAGENKVRYAAVIANCKHAAGRTGMGAVMGSKLLKAVVVVGNKKIGIFDKEKVAEIAKWGAKKAKEPNFEHFTKLGTARITLMQNDLGGLLTKNFKSGVFKKAYEISGEKLEKTLLKKREGCFACALRCKRVVSGGKYNVDDRYGGPEYETIATLGSNLMIDDLSAIAKAHELCNKYGLDTISAGGTIAWAMEAFEKGDLTLDETDGIKIQFGSAKIMLKLIEMISKREGIGNLLAEGSLKAAEQIGKESMKYVITSKGMEYPAHMPRVKKSMSLAYSVIPIGPDHNASDHDPNIEEKEYWSINSVLKSLGFYEGQKFRSLDRDKVRFFAYTQIYGSALDLLNLCLFCFGSGYLYPSIKLIELIRASTGWEDFSMWELMKAGERRIVMMKEFNKRQGFSSKDDNIPERMLEPLDGGPSDGFSLNKKEYENAKNTYYEIMGWGINGHPTYGKYVELGIEEFYKDPKGKAKV